jgi:hypothetical protein
VTIQAYGAPQGVPVSEDYSVRIRAISGGGWKSLSIYQVKVDMHHVREASMASFDMNEPVEVEVTCLTHEILERAAIRPLSYDIAFHISGATLFFTLDRPSKLSVEPNGDRFHNLHLFANAVEDNPPSPDGPNVLLLAPTREGRPVIHRTEDILRLASTPAEPGSTAPDTIYFAPGLHYLEETVLRIPSGKTVYLAGGAVVVGSLVCDNVKDVKICGRGILYLGDFHRYSAFRGVRILFSEDIEVDGITLIDPPHYSIYIGKSRGIRIRNFKSFSNKGWSDGIDMMASSDIDIEDVFLRTSDDCIAIYGSRWDYRGDARRIQVRSSVLWADVAHPMMIGIHGDHEQDGDIIEDILFENIDILEHHEPQPNYMGAMSINAGDKNVIRNVTYDRIRVEDFELGQLLDVRVVWNKDYNPVAGRRIENVVFRNIEYNGSTLHPSRIHGFSADNPVDGVSFINVRINGQAVTDAESGQLSINEYARHISFRQE